MSQILKALVGRLLNSAGSQAWYVDASNNLVQDSSNAGNIIMAKGGAQSHSLVIGASSIDSDVTTAFAQPSILLSGAGSSADHFVFIGNGNNATGPHFQLCKTRTGSNGSNANTIVANNDELGSLGFWGADGANYKPAGSLRMVVDGTPSTNNIPSRMIFATRKSGDSQTTDRWAILSTGELQSLTAATEATGSGSASLGSNSPATTNTAPYTWFKVKTSDGSTGYIPVFK